MPWVIDVDHIADPDVKASTNCNAKGIAGPRGYHGSGDELTHKFRLLDDDKELIYEGRSGKHADFGPLDDFGTPNAGCTIIQYIENGKWVSQ